MKHYFKSNLFPFLTLLAIAILGGLVYWGITYNSAAFKLAEKFNQAPEIKKDYTIDKAALEIKPKDQNSVGVVLGEANAKEFVPNLEINKWDGETKFKLKPDISQIPADQKKVTMDGDKINYETPKVTYQYYNKPDASEDGGYEFSEILKVKPDTNVFTTPIETENLDFFYQPALNQEIKIGEQGVVSCTETECLDKDGKVVNERPENVVGSYAVYYKDGKSGDYTAMGGKNYKTGKAFHIFRPQVIDANGNKVWAEMKVDTDKNTLAITVPQDFLDKAVYPVTVDPTFGYYNGGVPGGSYSTIGSAFALFAKDTPASAGTVTSISAYARKFINNENFKGAIWNYSSYALLTNRVSPAVTVNSATPQWWVSNYSTGPVIDTVAYYVGLVCDGTSSGARFYYDTSAGNGGYDSNNYITPTDLSDPLGNTTYRWSIYATYTAAPSASCGDGTCNGSETHATCPADCPLTANSENSTQINSPLSGRFLDSSLKGYWSFDGADTTWTSATAATTNDLSGNSNTGTLTNMSRSTSPVAGISGQGLKFDGVDDKVMLPRKVIGTDTVTVCAWIKPNPASVANYTIIHNEDFTFFVSVNNNPYEHLVVTSNHGNTMAYSDWSHSVVLGAWQHVCVKRLSGGLATFYINGVQSGTADQDSGTPTNDYSFVEAIGSYSYGAYSLFSGSIDEVRIYNRALSASEITAQYNAGAAKMKINTPAATPAGLSSGLVGYWPFNGPNTNWTSATTGTTNDLSGNNNTGTMTNMSRSTSPVAGISGQALSFDGVGSYVSVADKDSYSLTSTGFTASAWVYLNATTSGQTWAISKGGAGGYEWSLGINGVNWGDGAFSSELWQLDGNACMMRKSNTISVANKWYHIAFVVANADGATAPDIYVNGVLDNGSSFAWNGVPSSHGNGTTPVNIGRRGDGLQYWNGKIDDVRVYNRALSASEVQELYQQGQRRVKIKAN